jgi:hypothetical protein
LLATALAVPDGKRSAPKITVPLASLGTVTRACRVRAGGLDVGDTTADVFAGLLAESPVIGYANKPGMPQPLADVQAAAVTTDLADITTALRASSPRRRFDPSSRARRVLSHLGVSTDAIKKQLVGYVGPESGAAADEAKLNSPARFAKRARSRSKELLGGTGMNIGGNIYD